ncbi:diguanylate cyclase domain-containing protein [Sporomusa malonica]|uniref:PAS domain S-box-containing protein/diguanylate cyclase (GGDEF) domain-containing protein n=1 Tax=Sporomusa malonica TaxID=112901 RepID=A0A1W2DFL1_9FIRM|nr:HD domain-containing phosphohydrolase [Sporomusa malonica]SMC95766.1 PAS domain S-box-containing protein/diguanylate cyclase (GGDEF) domain-containing protein [Sporomusa malonica]
MSDKYRQIFLAANDAIFIEALDGRILDANPAACELLGYTYDELTKMKVADIVPPEFIDNMPIEQVSLKKRKPGDRWFCCENLRKDGTRVAVDVKVRPFEMNGELCVVAIVRDISELKQAEANIFRQNMYLTALHDTTLTLMNHLDIRALLESMVGRAGELVGTRNGFVALVDEVSGNFILKVTAGFYSRHVGMVVIPGEGVMGQVVTSGEPCIVNQYALWPYRKQGRDYDMLNAVIGMPLKNGDNLVGVIGLAYDEPKEFGAAEVAVLSRFADLASIALANATLYTALQQELAERRQIEKKLRYMSYYDGLTGLYNRTFFKQEMRRLEGAGQKPVAIILCDVDGLKLINDTLGHEMGDLLLDAVATVLKASVRSSDVVARIGGDEFAILLPQADGKQVGSICSRIRSAVDMYNAEHLELPLSMSIGYAVAEAGMANAAPMNELFREADDNMYREKLHRSRTTRSAIVKALLKALEARDFITEGHGDRMQEWMAELAAALKLSERRTGDLKLLAQFHDIGKVGIPDRILFKPGQLTPEEHIEVQRHADIGYRIAQSISDLIPIADFILKHHERWDGSGYPIGLRGSEIPLECRMLAIVDAYDAMTSDRPYRKALNPAVAAAELKQQAGNQFDPDLTAIFCEIVERRYRGDCA